MVVMLAAVMPHTRKGGLRSGSCCFFPTLECTIMLQKMKSKRNGNLPASLIPKAAPCWTGKQKLLRKEEEASSNRANDTKRRHSPSRGYTHKEASRNHGGASRGRACTGEQAWQVPKQPA